MVNNLLTKLAPTIIDAALNLKKKILRDLNENGNWWNRVPHPFNESDHQDALKIVIMSKERIFDETWRVSA